MKTYEVELDDGRIFEVDADEQPTNEEVMEALGFSQQQPVEATEQGRTSSNVNRFMRDMAGVVPNALGGIGELSSSFVRNLNPVAWAAKAGVPGAQGLVDAYASPGEFLSKTVADGMTETIEEIAPVNPAFQSGFDQKASGAIGQAVGQLGSMLIPAKALSLGPAAARAIGLGQAGAMGAKIGADTAESYGVEDDLTKAAMTYGFGGVEALTEAIGGIGGRDTTAALMGTLRSAARPGSAIARFGKTAGIEGVEEMIAGEGQDLLTKGLIQEDPARPGFSLSGTPLPPDTLTMQNLYRRLEEGALGAIGGTVFASVEAFNSRTPIQEAFSARLQAHSRIRELQNQESLTPEEQSELSQIQEADRNVSAFLERQGEPKVRQALETIINNPEASDDQRDQAISYRALLDNRDAIESAPDATQEEKESAQSALDNHPLNGLNGLNRANQNASISGTWEERAKSLQDRLAAQQQRQETVQRVQSGEAVPTEEVREALSTGISDIVTETAAEIAEVAPETAAALTAINEPTQPAPYAPPPDLPSEATADYQGYKYYKRDGQWYMSPSSNLPPPPGVTAAQLEAASTQATPQRKALEDVSVSNVDTIIQNGGGQLGVFYKGQPVEFEDFAVTVDGNSAEVYKVKVKDRGEAAKGVGTLAYIQLGEELAKHGITLTSSAAQYADGRKLWDRLVSMGRAERTGSGQYVYKPQTQQQNATSETIQPESLPEQPQSGVESRTTQETVAGDSVLGAEGSQEEGQVNVPPQTQVPQPTAPPTQAQAPKPVRRPKVRLGISVSPREVQRAMKKFQRFGTMRIATVEELLNDANLRALFPTQEEWEKFAPTIPYSEGLSQDGSGNAVIIPENLAIYDTDQARAKRLGTTAGEEAMIRVMMHENWHGIERWIEHDPSPEAKTLKDRYDQILSEITPEEMDNLAKRRYKEFSNWRNDPFADKRLRSEVLAERREMAELTGEPDSLVEKFLAWLRDVLKTVTGSTQEVTPDELQELFDAWHRAQKATQTRAGPVQQSLPEIPARPTISVTYNPPADTGNTLDEVLDSLWRPFYVAWESNQEGPINQEQLATDWAEHISDPDFLFGKDVELRIQKRNEGRNWIDFVPEPSQTAPEIKSSLSEALVTSKMERAYMDAVNRGDMETAQKMVDEASKKAGYTSPIVFHGTEKQFNEFKESAIGRMTGADTGGFWFSDNRDAADYYHSGEDVGGRVITARLKIKNPLRVTSEQFESSYPKGPPFWLKKAVSEGYDGVILEEIQDGDMVSTVYAVQNPSQIKSADPVTRDDQGNIIPLSQRFNPQTPDIRFSLPELTPEQRQARLVEITERLSYAPSAEQQEGQTPVQATQDQRQYAEDGTPVDLYRQGVSGPELDALSNEALGLAISQSPDGPSQTFGQELMRYLRGEIPTFNGLPDNLFLKSAIAINLEHSPLQRAQMGIDAADLRKAIQQTLSVAGRALQTAAHGRLYQNLREMNERAQEMTDKKAKDELGTDDFKAVSDQANKEVVDETKPLAEDVTAEDVSTALADSAQSHADSIDFAAAIASLPPNEQKAVRDLLNELEELDELLRMEAELSAGQVGPAASRAEVRAQKLTLEEVRAKIAQKRKNITKLVEEIQKAKVEGDPVEAAKRVVKRTRKPKTVPPTQNDRIRQWASGKLEVEGLEKPVKTIQKYIQAGGLNVDALTTVLIKAFPEADPVFVSGLVNRMAVLIDGRATKEGILDDLKRGGGKPDPKLVEKMVRIAERSRKAREKAAKSMVNKLGKVKNPTPQKLKQRSKFVNLIQQGMNSGILDSDLVRAAFADAYDLHGLSPERLKTMADLMNEIDRLPSGMVRETFFLQWMQLLNEIAPASSISGMALSAYLGYVLQGVGTMLMQTSNMANYLPPLALAHNFGKIYAGTQGTPLKKLFSALNLRRNFQLTATGLKESRDNFRLIRAGLSGLKTSTGQGLGVTPVELTQTPYETSLAWTPWGQISQFRMQSNKLMEQMGVLKLFKGTRFPAWVASRSFQAIRGAEGWSGGTEKNMAFRMIAWEELQKQGKPADEAWMMVSDALDEKTNAQMWQEAYQQADQDIANKTVAKSARKQRANELVQDMLDQKWNLILQNRHRQQSAHANFKTDPITPLGAGAYKLVSMALEHQNWGPIPNPLRFGFLFPRFFINSMEQSFTYTPAGLITALGLPTSLPPSKLKERQQRIIQIYGSLENYKSQRLSKGLAGTTLLAGVGAMMAAAMQAWDGDDDEPPMFWLTGDVIGRYDRRGILSETGWWAPNTMYIMGMKINYVNSSPQLGMILNAAGNIGDRFMFPELLGKKYNAQTKEYEESFAEQWIRPIGEATAAPMSRSTYRVFYDALDNAMGGDFKKLIRLGTQPFSGTATALTLGAIPSLKTFEKLEKSNIAPRSPQDISQTLQAGVPFANSLGLDTGKPLYAPFGETLSPYSFFTFQAHPQEATPESRQAANILLDLGVSKQPPKLEYLGDGVVEVAHDGKYYLLGPDQRDEVIFNMGQVLARSIIREKDRLKKLEKDKGRDAVSDRVGALATEARKRALSRFRPQL